MWLVVDTETTGLDPKRHSILSFGCVLLHEDLETQLGAFEVDILPIGEIDPQALKINKIQISAITHTRESAIQEFLTWLDTVDVIGKTVSLVGHNVPFDQQFLNQLPFDWNTLFDRRVLDVKVIAAFLQLVGLDTKSTSLSALVEQFVTDSEIRQLPAHRALNDCQRTLAVLQAFRRMIT